MKQLQIPLIIYTIICVVYAIIAISTWGAVYWDFGDGNYLYVARRIREGAVLYKDILAPQPPLHTWMGAAAQSLGELIAGSALIGIRTYCLLLRLITGLLVLLIAAEFFRCRTRATVAAFIYLILPIGFWWSLCYQSENIEIPFLLLAILGILKGTKRWIIIAGISSALAMHCNMTAVPYMAVNALFLLCRTPRLLPYFLLPVVLVYTFIAGFAQWITGGYFLDNVVFNQVGTFPRTDILQSSDPNDSFPKYVWRKISSQTMEVVAIEGGYLIAAFAGLALAAAGHARSRQESQDGRQIEYLCWMSIGLMLSICFTAKGGTVNYIFTIGEPAVALFAAHALVALFRATLPSRQELSATTFYNTVPPLRILFPILVAFFVAVPGFRNISWTLSQIQSELPARDVRVIEEFIRTYAEPGDKILAPPFYAWQTDTIVAAELAENYIWQIKFLNESFDGIEGEAHAKFRELADELRSGDVKVVLLDMAQTGRVPYVQEAIASHFQPAEPRPYRTRNTSLGLYIRKEDTIRHFPIMQE